MERLALSPDGTLGIEAGMRFDPEIAQVKQATRSNLRGILDFIGIVGSGVAGTAAFVGTEAALGSVGASPMLGMMGAGAAAAAAGWVTDKLATKTIDKATGPDTSLAA